MDPLSITAAVVGIATAVGQAGSITKKLSSFRNAPDEVLGLGNQVTDLSAVLTVIGDAVRVLQPSHDAELSDSLGSLHVFHQILARVQGILQELDDLIQTRLLKPGVLNPDGSPKASRQGWASEKDRLMRLCERLRDSRLNLVVIMTALNILQE